MSAHPTGWHSRHGDAGRLGDPCVLWLPPSPAQRRGCSPGGIVLLLYSLGTALLWMKRHERAGGICVKRVVLGLRAAGCCIPRVPVLLNKGATKENYGF